MLQVFYLKIKYKKNYQKLHCQLFCFSLIILSIYINNILQITLFTNHWQMQHSISPSIEKSSEVNHMIQSQSITSSAFPVNKPIQQHSVFHKIIKQSKQITNNITMRLTNKQSDIRQIWNFQLEWFPLSYGEVFYNRILEGPYRCLVTQTQVIIQKGVLQQILMETYNKQKQKYDEQLKKGYKRNPIFIKPSSYFIQQGIYLFEINKSTQHTYDKNIVQNKKENQALMVQPLSSINQNQNSIQKIKIIIGVMVFDLTTSKGYLRNSWWQQNFFSTINSIYINTIGVMLQFRKTGIARKMIQWLLQQALKDQIFKFVHLHVIQYNIAAIKLYEKLGFIQLSFQRDYYHIDGKSYTGKLLGLYINGGRKNIGWAQLFNSFWR